MTHDLTALREKLAGRRVVASISGGKDSAAMSLYLHELGIEHDRVFMDTGWEADATYEYLRGPLTERLGAITEIRDPLGMEAQALRKGMFASKQRRWCTDLLKVQPMQRHLRGMMDAGQDVISAVGIRAGESEARSKLVEWEWSDGFDCEIWRPILGFTFEDVREIHARNGLSPNPLYLAGAERVGCWPCIYARKSEIKLIAKIDAPRVTRLRVLEERVTEKARALVEARGETLTHPRTWFQSPLDREGTWSIDRVVEWSRTAHGGRQTELFDSTPADAGCMRWGLCETSPPDEDGTP